MSNGSKADSDPEEFFQSFRQQIKSIDDIAIVVLKGHLLCEESLDDLIGEIFFHPEYLDGRLNFERKVRVVRAMCIRTNNHPHWELVLALNTLRNEIAHRTPSEGRRQKIAALRHQVLSTIPEKKVALHRDDSDLEMTILACALAWGFLATVEEDLSRLRDLINEIDAGIHPELARIPRRAKNFPD